MKYTMQRVARILQYSPDFISGSQFYEDLQRMLSWPVTHSLQLTRARKQDISGQIAVREHM